MKTRNKTATSVILPLPNIALLYDESHKALAHTTETEALPISMSIKLPLAIRDFTVAMQRARTAPSSIDQDIESSSLFARILAYARVG